MDRRKLVDSKAGFMMDKRSALDGLLNKLDKQISREGDLKVKDPQVQQLNPQVAIGGGIGAVASGAVAKENLFKIGSNPFNPSMSPTSHRRKGRKAGRTSGDPLKMKAQMRQARQAGILNRHSGNDEAEEVEVDGDLKTNLDFVDENKFKTMEWKEPDGSITTLKFDEDGTLVGKETTTKSRPDKFSKDLKKAVAKNALALKDYEDSLMTDPVT